MPRVKFEPTITGFERAKVVHALHRMVTVIGPQKYAQQKKLVVIFISGAV
jgi:hypothetical protein